MKLIAIKTKDGRIKGKLAFCCRMLKVSRQGFYKYLSIKDRPWKYQNLADAMIEIQSEDVCPANDTATVLYDMFQDHTYAEACLARMLGGAYRLEMNGKNMRNMELINK